MGKEEQKQKARARHLQDNYNLTIEQSDAIEEYQGNVCWVCGRPEHVPNRRLATDHAHTDPPLIRGKLCSQCNPLLGKLENAFIRLGLHKAGLNFVQIVERLAAYVKNPPAVAALGKEVFGYRRPGTQKHRKFLKRQKLQNKQTVIPLTPHSTAKTR